MSQEYENVAPTQQYDDVLNMNLNDSIPDEKCEPEIDQTDGYVLPDVRNESVEYENATTSTKPEYDYVTFHGIVDKLTKK